MIYKTAIKQKFKHEIKLIIRKMSTKQLEEALKELVKVKQTRIL